MCGDRPRSTWISILWYRPTPENMDSVISSNSYNISSIGMFKMYEFFAGQLFAFSSIQISINIESNDGNGSVGQSQTCSKNSALAQASVGLSILLGFSSQLCFASRILRLSLYRNKKTIMPEYFQTCGWLEREQCEGNPRTRSSCSHPSVWWSKRPPWTTLTSLLPFQSRAGKVGSTGPPLFCQT